MKKKNFTGSQFLNFARELCELATAMEFVQEVHPPGRHHDQFFFASRRLKLNSKKTTLSSSCRGGSNTLKIFQTYARIFQFWVNALSKRKFLFSNFDSTRLTRTFWSRVERKNLRSNKKVTKKKKPIRVVYRICK